MTNNKAFRISKLDPKHTSSLNVLSSTSQTQAQHASSLGITTIEASHRLQLLIDEGLAVQQRGPDVTIEAPKGVFKTYPGRLLDSYIVAP